MAEMPDTSTVITEAGILALGSGLPPGPSVSSFFKNENVVQVVCGQNHSAVVLESGRVLVFGKELLGTEISDVVTGPSVVRTLSSVRITQAACGHKFTLFVSDKGEVFACGDNTRGQLGLGHKTESPEPVLVSGLPFVRKVAAGWLHSAALTDGGEIWVCGCNDEGQLGLGVNEDQSSFTRVPDVSQAVSDVSCGSYHTVLLSRSRVLLMSGRNKYGQLGLGPKNHVNLFQPVTLSSPVAAIACGSSHTVALTESGTVWTCGWNVCGQLGTGEKTERSTPTKMVGLENYKITKVFAGRRHSAVLTEEGDVLVCGRGKNGELGRGKEDISVPSLLLKSPGLVVQQVAFAWGYSLLLVASTQNNEPTSRTQDGQARGCVTDTERSLMKSLECPVCLKIMCAPIHLCVRGHSVCAGCRSNTVNCSLCRQPYTEARSITLEGLSTILQLPCVDCFERMPFALLEQHALVCLDRTYCCPVQQPCGWSGRPETMLAHTSSAHRDQTWRDLPHLFVHSTADELVHTDVLAAHNEVFTLHRRYNQTAREFQAAVRYIGAPENKHKFMFEFAFYIISRKGNTFRRNICADTETIDDMFQSANCVSLKRGELDVCLQQDKLVCQVAVLEAECGDIADGI